MNFKWFQNKLTFVIIPEANGSVTRIKLSRAAVCFAAVLVLLSVGTSLCFLFYRVQSAADLQHKTKTIEQLQTEVFKLSKQAKEVIGKVEEMKRLEQDLRKLAPPGSVPVHSLDRPVTDRQAENPAVVTAAGYAELHVEISELTSRLSKSRQLLMEKQEREQHTPTLWPTLSNTVTSVFGYRKDPFTKKNSFHRGIDIAGKLNDPIYAAADGVIHHVGYDKLHGNHVIVEHFNGLRTWYMHLNSTQVKKGEQVRKGDPIGKLGTTGRSTGPHLHYEVQLNGKSVDPAPYLMTTDEKRNRWKS